MSEVEYECPLCGEKFEGYTQLSCTIFGRNLDFEPFGAACIPTPVAKCPKCGLVFDYALFTEDEINKLKKIFANNNIFKQEPDMPDYYYLAREFELLGKEIDIIIYYYHSAIWENKNYFEKIANIIIPYFEKIDETNKNYYIYKLIKLDFLRRLKQFDPAKDLIETLKNDHYFQKDNNGKLLDNQLTIEFVSLRDNNNFPKDDYKKLLDYQLKLIEKKDIEEHEMP